MATPATDEAIEAAHRAIARTEKLLVERRKSITGPEDFLGAESVRVSAFSLATGRPWTSSSTGMSGGRRPTLNGRSSRWSGAPRRIVSSERQSWGAEMSREKIFRGVRELHRARCFGRDRAPARGGSRRHGPRSLG